MNAGLSARLQAQLCASFEVAEQAPGRWTVRTPLLYGDGDALPVFIRFDEADGWLMTDDGMAASHLFFDDFALTDARLVHLAGLVEAHDARLTNDRSVVMHLEAAPDAYDIGDFLQLVAQIQSLARLSTREREQTRYVNVIRQRVEELLLSPAFERNWSPPALGEKGRLYRADLFVGVPDQPGVALFAASTSERVALSTLCVGKFRSVANAMPLLAYREGRVSSDALSRFIEEVGDESAVVEAHAGFTQLLEGALEKRGVALRT